MLPEARIVSAVLAAYREAAFPMVDPATGELGWFRPDPRAVLPLDPAVAPPCSGDGLHVPRSLAKRLRRCPFEVTTDRAFAKVIRACAEPREETASSSRETWIDGRIIGLFQSLHVAGHAHSVEAWEVTGNTPRLVGGVYGLAIGRVFCAESMFTRATDAGKTALVCLVRHLVNRGFTLMDTQFTNPHVARFGVREIPSDAYLEHLAKHDQHLEWRPPGASDILRQSTPTPPGSGTGF